MTFPTSKLISFDDFLGGADARPVPGPDPSEPPDWPEQITHLSANSLATLDRCPELFRRRYLHGEIEAPNIHMTWGSAIHRAHEQNFVQKIESHEDLPVRQMKDIYRHALSEQIMEDEAKTQKEMTWPHGYTLEVVTDRGVDMVAAYHTKVSPRVQPIKVEAKFEVPANSGHELPGDSPVPVIGYVDIETANTGIDLKSVGRKEMKPEWRAQGHIYAAVIKKPFSYHLTVKTQQPQIVTPQDWSELLVPYTPSSNMRAIHYVRLGVAKIKFLYQTFGPNQPWPGAYFQPYNRLCGICGFRPTCFWTTET